MSKRNFKIIRLIIPILGILVAALFWDFESQWKVLKVADGDTVTLVSQTGEKRKVRLYGIDAPERKQAFGKASKERLTELLHVPFTVSFANKDRYGRFIGRFQLQNEVRGKTDVAEILISEGLGWWYEKYAPNDVLLKAAQAEAQKSKVGLWSKPRPLAPWEYRKQKRSK